MPHGSNSRAWNYEVPSACGGALPLPRAEKKGVLHVNVLIVSGYFHPGSLFAGLCQRDIEDQARNKILQLFSKEEDKH